MKRSTSQLSSPTAPNAKKSKTNSSSETYFPVDNNADGWTKVEKRKQKKVKKQQVKQEIQQPRFLYSNSEIIKRNHPIGIDDIRELVLHITADAPPPNWCRVDNASMINKTLALLVPGITSELLSIALPTSATKNPNIPLSIPLPSSLAGKPSVPFLASTFSHACPTRAPGDATRMHSVYSTFFNGPVSHQERQRRETMRALALGADKDKTKNPAQYLLTVEQMAENDYPVPSYMADVFQKPEGWVEVPQVAKPSLLTDSSKTTPQRKIYALDCEMCMTEDGKDLTRVCMIDYHTGKVVYDQFVKPAKPIIDYLTRWSGITAEALAGVTTTIEDVQAHILKFLSPPPPNPFTTKPTSQPLAWQTPILLGHSLESDLRALRLCHPYCIDTALLYHHPRGRPLKPGLAWLTKKWLGREIQNRGEGGHNPEEDARACLDLVKKKCEEGDGFGEFKVDWESIFERMSKSMKRGEIRSAVVDHGNPSVMHGAKASSSVSCTTDEEVVKGVLEALPNHGFVFGRLVGLANVLGWTTPKDKDRDPSTPAVVDPAPAPTAEQLSDALREINGHLQKIHSSLPPRTALILFTGHSDPRKMSALNARRHAFENALRSNVETKLSGLSEDEKWTTVDARLLEEEVEKARMGLVFLGVKQ